MEGANSKEAKKRAVFAASAMIGALTMARVVTDPLLSDTILRSAAKPSPAYVWGNKQNSSGTHLGVFSLLF